MEIGAITMENIMETMEKLTNYTTMLAASTEKLKIKLLHDPAILLLGKYPKSYLYSYIHCSITHNSQDIESS